MDNPKCRVDTFSKTAGNFLALPKEDLILYKRGQQVYCFTHAEAEKLLIATAPRVPGTRIRFSKNFITSLQSYYAKALPPTESSVKAPKKESVPEEYQERLPGEQDQTNTDLGWDRALKYCTYEFNRFIAGYDTDMSAYEKAVALGDCAAYSDDFIQVAKVIKELFPEKELKEHDWYISWHPHYPGIELDTRNKDILKPDILSVDNIFNCQYQKPNYQYNMICEGKDNGITTFLEQLFLNKHSKDQIQENIGTWNKHELKLPAKYTIKIEKTEPIFGWDSEISKRIKTANRVYEITGNQTEEAVNALERGETINDDILHIFISFEQIINQDMIDKIVRDGKLYFGQKYKIHLQPKPEYQLWTFKKVFDIINRPDIRPLVSNIKALIPYTRVFSAQKIPSLVIYPVFGQHAAQKVLSAIVSGFSGRSSQLGLNITPRYNHTLNGLIYWANGDGGFKDKLIANGRLDEYYDSTVNWAHILCGDEQEKCHIEPQQKATMPPKRGRNMKIF